MFYVIWHQSYVILRLSIVYVFLKIVVSIYDSRKQIYTSIYTFTFTYTYYIRVTCVYVYFIHTHTSTHSHYTYKLCICVIKNIKCYFDTNRTFIRFGIGFVMPGETLNETSLSEVCSKNGQQWRTLLWRV